MIASRKKSADTPATTSRCSGSCSATGQQYSVREFVQRCAKILGLDLTWQGNGVDEKAIDKSGKAIVAVDPRYFRPTEVETLLGDSSKAKRELGWTRAPPSTS